MTRKTPGNAANGRSGRRAPDEVKRLLLQAAQDLFSKHGYHGTTTRQIAEEAGVGESVLFRNFGSKAELFETTIVTVFTEFVDHWVNTSNEKLAAASDMTEVLRTFVQGCYELSVEHRELFHTVVAARVNRGDRALSEVAERVSAKFGEGMLEFQSLLLAQKAAGDFREMDGPVTVAVAVGSVMSLVLLDDWLFPPNRRRPGKARQIEEATKMLLYGVTGS